MAIVDTGPGLIAAIEAHRPDAAVVDIRLPPTFTDEGLRAAIEIRRRTKVAILVLSQYAEAAYARELLTTGGGTGYLIKDRISRPREFVEALVTVAGGGTGERRTSRSRRGRHPHLRVRPDAAQRVRGPRST